MKPPAAGEGARAMQYLMTYLPENIPSDTTTCLLHGDLRIGNLLVNRDSKDVAAVLDWELSTLGHPQADLTYCCIPYHLPQDDTGTKGLVSIDLETRDIPSEAEFIQRYCNATGRDNIEQ